MGRFGHSFESPKRQTIRGELGVQQFKKTPNMRRGEAMNTKKLRFFFGSYDDDDDDDDDEIQKIFDIYIYIYTPCK